MMRILLLTGLVLLSYAPYRLQASEPAEAASPAPASTVVLSMAYQMMDGDDRPTLSAFSHAATGYFNLLRHQGTDNFSRYMAVADFSMASTKKRLWIIDMANLKVVHHTYVAHGRNSGDNSAYRFSNIPESYQSSLGFYRTGEIYQGKHGRSLRLEGLDRGFNDKAWQRAIVIHGADYVSESFIRQNGRLGRSFGCPAVPQPEVNEVIDLLGTGSLFFIYYPDRNYLQRSAWLQTPSAQLLQDWWQNC